MKITSFAPLLLLFQLWAAPIWAGTIKQADYPVRYEVMNASKSRGVAIERLCSMMLRDPAKPNVDLTVQRKGYGSCHVLDNGKVFSGRENQKKNAIELVIPVGKAKARVEGWQIVGVVDNNPK